MAVTRHSDAVGPVRSSGPFSIWFTRHVSTSIAALGRLVRHPFSSLMIILVIAVTLALPAAINLVVKNARAISGSWDNALDFSVFLKQELSEVRGCRAGAPDRAACRHRRRAVHQRLAGIG